MQLKLYVPSDGLLGSFLESPFLKLPSACFGKRVLSEITKSKMDVDFYDLVFKKISLRTWNNDHIWSSEVVGLARYITGSDST